MLTRINALDAENASGYVRRVPGFTGSWKKMEGRWQKSWTKAFVLAARRALLPANQERYGLYGTGKDQSSNLTAGLSSINIDPTGSRSHNRFIAGASVA